MRYELPKNLEEELYRHDKDLYFDQGRHSETIIEWLQAEYSRGFLNGLQCAMDLTNRTQE